MNFHFILVEPAVPENIGASARAIKTMGFNSLRLINPANHLSNEAKWLAHASHEILENASVYENLKDALHDIDFVIASTAKHRSTKLDYIEIKELPSLIIDKGDSISNIAIVFGREESGLTNEELENANITSHINMHQKYPSLNLSQAVMVYAHTLSNFSLTAKIKESTINSDNSFKNLLNKIHYLIEDIGLSKNENLSSRLYERAGLLNEEDINLLHSVCNKINEKLNRDNL